MIDTGSCIVDGCRRPATLDSDECERHLALAEREASDRGETPAPCDHGHYGCAHREGGACHGYQPDPDSTLCPDHRAGCAF